MRLRYFTIIFCAIALFSSCEVEDTIPATNIQAKTFENILYDMQMADVYSQSVRKDTTENYGQKNQDSLSRYYNEIFKHYNVTYDQFNTTMQWYKEHPMNLDTIYNNVLTRVSADEEKYKYLQPAPKTDSPATSGAPVL